MTKNSIDGIVLTFNLKIVETDTKTIPLTNMFMTVYFQWLGTNASIKSGRGKLVFFWPKPSNDVHKNAFT